MIRVPGAIWSQDDVPQRKPSRFPRSAECHRCTPADLHASETEVIMDGAGRTWRRNRHPYVSERGDPILRICESCHGEVSE